jgi:hypothetical protein
MEGVRRPNGIRIDQINRARQSISERASIVIARVRATSASIP